MRFNKGLAIMTLLGALLSVGACQSSAQIMSARLNDTNYPDLLKIPPAPTSVKTDSDWSKMASTLSNDERVLRKNPMASDYNSANWNTEWAKKSSDIIEKDPKNADVPNIDAAVDWAARMRAIMDKHQ